VTGEQRPLLFVERRAQRLAERQARQRKAAKVIEPPVEEKPRGQRRASVKAKKKS
jgi:hypothetical protein